MGVIHLVTVTGDAYCGTRPRRVSLRLCNDFDLTTCRRCLDKFPRVRRERRLKEIRDKARRTL